MKITIEIGLKEMKEVRRWAGEVPDSETWASFVAALDRALKPDDSLAPLRDYDPNADAAPPPGWYDPANAARIDALPEGLERYVVAAQTFRDAEPVGLQGILQFMHLYGLNWQSRAFAEWLGTDRAVPIDIRADNAMAGVGIASHRRAEVLRDLAVVLPALGAYIDGQFP